MLGVVYWVLHLTLPCILSDATSVMMEIVMGDLGVDAMGIVTNRMIVLPVSLLQVLSHLMSQKLQQMMSWML